MKIPAQGWIAVCDHAAVLRPSTSDNPDAPLLSRVRGSVVNHQAPRRYHRFAAPAHERYREPNRFSLSGRCPRRRSIDQCSALIAALNAGRLRHAVLDVFRTEPLPAEHAFWSHPKITITPHNSSATNPATALGQIIDNIRRATTGEKILHPVDPVIGY